MIKIWLLKCYCVLVLINFVFVITLEFGQKSVLKSCKIHPGQNVGFFNLSGAFSHHYLRMLLAYISTSKNIL